MLNRTWGRVGASQVGERFTAEQIISKLRDAEVLLAQGQKVVPAPEAQLLRAQALNPILWSGLQMVPGLT